MKNRALHRRIPSPDVSPLNYTELHDKQRHF